MTDATQDTFDAAYEARSEREAAEAAARIRDNVSWDDWLKIGAFLVIGRNKAMMKAGTNEPVGARYNKAFGEWMDERQWLRDIDKATRIHAMWCSDHVPELKTIRENMGQTMRERSNHPTVMRRKWDKLQREGEKAPGERKEPKAKQLEREIEAIAAERDKWRHKAEKDGSLFDLRNDSAKTIAQVMFQHMSAPRIREVVKALQSESERRKAVQKQAG